MKTRIPFLAALALLLSVSFTSCSKEGRHGKDENKTVTLNVSLAKGDVYNLDLSPYGDEDDVVSIDTQAKEYVVSAVSKSSSFYNYQFQSAKEVKTTSASTETVVVKVAEPAGHCHHNDQMLITINFSLK